MPAATDTLSPIGSTVRVSRIKPTDVTSGSQFAALTLIEVGEVDNIGEYGPESSEQTRTRLKDGAVKKRKGPRNFGTMPLTLAMVPGDAGQQALAEAEEDSESWAVQIEFPDGTCDYFLAFVMSFKTNIGGAEAGTIMASSSFSIDTKPVRVYPA